MNKTLRIVLLMAIMAISAGKVYAQEEVVFEDITIKKNTYRLGISGAVDLGLSVMWATHNVGAEMPSDDGEHYAWGEKEDKTESFYDWRSYFDLIDGDLRYFKKYRQGHKEVLDDEDDVAHVRMGGSWRMPTRDEIEELLNRCKWKWTTYKEKKGFVVIGKTGNAIFLPAAGYINGTYLEDWCSGGKYWSKTRDNYPASHAYAIWFNAGGAMWGRELRCQGFSVRAVCPKE